MGVLLNQTRFWETPTVHQVSFVASEYGSEKNLDKAQFVSSSHIGIFKELYNHLLVPRSGLGFVPIRQTLEILVSNGIGRRVGLLSAEYSLANLWPNTCSLMPP